MSKIKYPKLWIAYHSCLSFSNWPLSKYPLSWFVFGILWVFLWPPCSPYSSSSCPINAGALQGSIWTSLSISMVLTHFWLTTPLRNVVRDFTGSPLAKTLGSQCRGPGFDPYQGTRSHMPQLKIPSAATKTQCSQINKENVIKSIDCSPTPLSPHYAQKIYIKWHFCNFREGL